MTHYLLAFEEFFSVVQKWKLDHSSLERLEYDEDENNFIFYFDLPNKTYVSVVRKDAVSPVVRQQLAPISVRAVRLDYSKVHFDRLIASEDERERLRSAKTLLSNALVVKGDQ